MQYASLTALLVEAMKELSKKNAELLNRLERLERELKLEVSHGE